VATATETDTILAWHFAPDTGRSRYTDEPIFPGAVFAVSGTPAVCGPFPHGCVRPMDALECGFGCYVSRVRLSGEMAHDRGKVAAQRREHLWCADAKRTLCEFALWCAGQPTDRQLPNVVELIAARFAEGVLWLAADAAARAAFGASRELATWTAAVAEARDAQNAELERRLLLLAPAG